MSDRELELVLQRMDRQDEQLERIEVHTRETNGRVRALELWQARVDGFRFGVVALSSVIASGVTLAVTILIP